MSLNRSAFFILLLVLALPAAATASPFDNFGTGPRAIAMGQAYAAVGGDTAGIFYNIATMTKAESFQLEFGYHRGDINIYYNDRKTDTDPDKGVTAGVIIGKSAFNRRYRIGAMLFTPDDHFVRLILPQRTAVTSLRYNNLNHIQGMIGGLAFQAFKWWSVGVGASFTSYSSGGVDFIISDSSPAEGYAKSVVGSTTVPVFGMYFEPTKWLNVGMSYREQQQMAMNLTNTIRMPNLKIMTQSGLVVFHNGYLDLLVESSIHFSPRQVQLGIAVKPTENLLIAADGTYCQWSLMNSSVAYSTAVMKGDFGIVFPTIPPLPLPDQGLHDTFNAFVGAEGQAFKNDWLKVDLRGGYNFQPTPVKEQTGLSNVADSDIHQISAGFGLTFSNISEVLPKPISLDFYDQFHYITPRIMHKTDPTNDVGDFEYRGYANSVGAAMTLRF